MRKLMVLIAALALVVPVLGSVGAASASIPAPAFQVAAPPQVDGGSKVAPEVQAELASLAPGEMTTVIVTLADQANVTQIPGAGRAANQQGIIRALQAKADASQRQIRALLVARSAQGRAREVIPFWVFNGLSVTATADVIAELAARADVRVVTPDAIPIVPLAGPGSNLPEANLSVIDAPALWNLGYSGQGVVVANMDTGVDVSHPDLSTRWRGGSNSWYDPYGQHPVTPTDLSGHGTWTMGVMVGGDAGGTAVGVAPQAQWIAVKIFDDAGSSTATAVHLGFQWLLDPDGNPATPDAPQVVNNSWAFGPGCNLEFQLDLQALLAAGIVPVFAAGNYGPGSSTGASPANYPEAFAVGATNNSDQLYAYSSRGPSACGEAQTTYPEVVAPGVNVRTTDRYGFYYNPTGTSLAAPHVAGGLALLLSAYPNLTADEQRAALINTAVDLGPAGPDNTFGYGRLDLLAAYNWLAGGGGNPTATPAPTPLPPTATPTSLPPTATPTSLPPTATPTSLPPTATPTSLPPTATPTSLPPTATPTSLPPTATPTSLPPTATPTSLPPTATPTSLPPTATPTSLPPTATPTSLPPTATPTSLPPTATPTSLPPTATPTSLPPTATPTSLPPTATPTPAPALSLHIGDLDRSAASAKSGWSATVTIAMHGSDHSGLGGVTVTGSWSGGYSRTASCTTDGTGVCTVATGNIAKKATSATFTVTNASRASYVYQPASNHDPDGDSNGTTITVPRP